jgi:hypothetical protein
MSDQLVSNGVAILLIFIALMIPPAIWCIVDGIKMLLGYYTRSGGHSKGGERG